MSQDLEKFRDDWKEELSHKEESKNEHNINVETHVDEKAPKCAGPGIILQKSVSYEYQKDNHSQDRKEPPLEQAQEQHEEQHDSHEQTYYPFMILGKLLKEGSSSQDGESSGSQNFRVSKTSGKRKYFDEEKLSQYKNAPLKRKHGDQSNSDRPKSPHLQHLQNKKHLKNISETVCRKERFLDLFIADLDEINEIPFFDVSLPKEVAVNIFKHLSLEDLCHCAQVSKSWRSLADDELLWCQICHKLGYEQDLCTSDKNNWKDVVRHHIVLQKTLVANWKGRVGKVSQLQHPQGGVVCAVSSYQHTVVAGYNNGDVKLWDLSRGDNCIFQPSSTALQIDESTEEGTVANYVLHVETSPQITVASYNHRHVDVWLNDHSLTPVSTLRCEGGWNISSLKLTKLSPLFALSQGYYVRIYKAERDMQFSMSEKLDLNKMVYHIKWLEPQSKQFNSVCMLAIATPNIISLYNPDKGAENIREIHNIIDSPVTCFDMTSDPYQMGVACGMFGGPTEAFKVHMYDLTSGRLASSLLGHTWMVTCMNMANSPQHTLITGCGDRKVRVYDTRKSTWPAMTLLGHCGKITTVQMDDWKVISGDEGGFVRVWDQRMRAKLWEWHNRHPVQYCSFSDEMLVVGNVPTDKFPVVDYQLERIPNTRYRGTVQVYDFSVDQMTQGVPEICHSSYDQPETYNYNIRLAVPYDSL